MHAHIFNCFIQSEIIYHEKCMLQCSHMLHIIINQEYQVQYRLCFISLIYKQICTCL